MPNATEPNATELFIAVIDHFNTREFERGAALFTDDAAQIDKSNDEVRTGPTGRILVYQDSIASFADAQTEITEIHQANSDEDLCFYEATYRGTHDGPLPRDGGRPPLLPTGKTVSIDFSGVVRAKNGKITYAGKYYDSAVYDKQLG